MEESERANAIVEHVRSYAHSPTHVRPVGDLSAAVIQSVVYCKKRLPTGIQWQVEIQPDIRAPFDSLEITLIIGNLLKNAVEAYEGDLDSKVPHIAIRLSAVSLQEEQTITLEVQDAAKFLSKQAVSDFSTPFHTSKDEGLGLGLTIVRQIADDMEADLQFLPITPKGLRVTLSWHLHKSTL